MTDPNAVALARLLLMGRAVDLEVEAWQVVNLAEPWTYDDTTWSGALLHADHPMGYWCPDCLACIYMDQLAAGIGPPLVVPAPPSRPGRHRVRWSESITTDPTRPLGGRHRS